VIQLTRLGGQPVAVNPDLIERAEATPDTVLTTVLGHKIIVSESVDEVVEQIRHWRAVISAEALALSRSGAVSGHGFSGEDGLTGDEQAMLSTSPISSLAKVLQLPQRGE